MAKPAGTARLTERGMCLQFKDHRLQRVIRATSDAVNRRLRTAAPSLHNRDIDFFRPRGVITNGAEI